MTKTNENLPKEFKFPHIPEYTGSPRAHKGLFVYEKIDGGNCSVRKEEGQIKGYSRSRRLTSQDMGNFYFRNFQTWIYSTPELQNLPEDKILCAEWPHYGVGHICYNPEFMNKFFLLNAYDQSKSMFMTPEKTVLVITHYKRILEYLKPEKVSVMIDGKISMEGGYDLVKSLEEKGYSWVDKK